MTLLVTGASGFVGKRVCADAVGRGIRVHAAVRRADALLPPGVRRVVVTDMADPTAWASALEGVSAVIHLAGRAHVMRERAAEPLDAFRAVNVGGTRGIVRAAAAAGVQRFVFVSSVKVHGEGGPRAYVPDDPPLPGDPYSRSKLEAEAVVWDEGTGMDRAVVRPPLVYGPGVGGNFRRLLRLAEVGGRWPLPLARIRNRRSLIFVGNFADALLHLAGSDAVCRTNRTWLVSDGEDLSTSELLARLGHAAGRRVRLVPCPEAAIAVVARWAGRTGEVSRLLDSLTVDISALRATGWSPPFTVDEGLRQTMTWWSTAHEN